LLSVFSSAFVLFGMSWLFGATGTTDLRKIAAQVTVAVAGPPAEGVTASADYVAAAVASPRMVEAALAILIAGLSFRLAAVPFHFYAPDVFQGVNSAGAAMLSLIPKVAGFAALLKVMPGGADWLAGQNLLAGVAIVTMTLGNLLAVRQHNLHRLLAYSSIAHSGYMLVGLTMGPSDLTIGGVTAMWFYLATYGLVTVGIFALLAAAGAERPITTDADLAGLSQTHPAIAVLLAASLFSLTGLPPTAGFLGKLNLLQASWSAGTNWGSSGWFASPRGVWLAGAIAANAAIAAWYYLRLIAAMYREAAVPQPKSRLAWAPAAAGSVCAIASILLFAAPQGLLDLAIAAAK
jgi:NADH-quinone oxidoreductase subunit N